MKRKALCIALLLACATLVYPVYGKENTAQVSTASVAVVRYDSSAVQVRVPADAVARYRSDSEFLYEREVLANPTLWQQFKDWLGSLFLKLFSGNETAVSTLWDILLYGIIGAGIVLVLFRVFGMTFTQAFSRAARRTSLSAELLDEDIHEMDFDALIEEAAQQALYRKAVRLLYLRTLKELTDRHYIAWSREKTNREYVRELTTTDMRKAFEQLTLLFEYIWYGEFPIDRALFEQSRTLFTNFTTMVGARP